MAWNLPDGLSPSDPYFNPPMCPYCNSVMIDNVCPDCGYEDFEPVYDCMRDYELDCALDSMEAD